MSIMDLIKKQFIEIIEWPNQDDKILAWKFPVMQNAINNGAKLTVREGQWALFLNEGKTADSFKAGAYTLTTKNLPILTTLKSWTSGFESPFKADILFLSAKENMGFKWGTSQPIVIRDPDFGIVRTRAFGSYSFQIINPALFVSKVIGIKEHYETSSMQEILKNIVLSKVTETIAETKMGIIDLSTQFSEISVTLTEYLKTQFTEQGFELTRFNIESVNVPEELQTAIDQQSKMNLFMKDQKKFAAWQTLNALPEAMKNTGGSGSGFQNIAADLAIGGMLGQVVGNTLKGVMQDSLGQNSQTSTAENSEKRSEKPSTESTATHTDSKFCTECGTKNPKLAKFCSNCGTKF
jgi:membrane protease subunit (stomatin/prohibitin family)